MLVSRSAQEAGDGWTSVPPDLLAAMTKVVMNRADRHEYGDGRAATCGLVRFPGSSMAPVSVSAAGPFPVLQAKFLETTLTVPGSDHDVVVFWVRPRAHVEDLRFLTGGEHRRGFPKRLTIAVGVEGNRTSGGSAVVLTSQPPERLSGLDATYRALVEMAVGFRKELERG